METIKPIAGFTLRNCDHCKKQYHADNRNLKRGWGLCCSKRCAAKVREKSKPGYNHSTVAENNIRRANWNDYSQRDYGYGRDQLGNYEGIGAGAEFDEMDGHFSNEDSFQFGRD